MGSDAPFPAELVPRTYFNPRSPHGERLTLLNINSTASEFQSTLPAWGATRQKWNYHHSRIISIHAPRMGSDQELCLCSALCDNFNPRSPHGERHNGTLHSVPDSHFNPRSPHGERLLVKRIMAVLPPFQSTLPAWGATLRYVFLQFRLHISIHAPRMGSDIPSGKTTLS